MSALRSRRHGRHVSINGRRARLWRAHGCYSAFIEREKAFPSTKGLAPVAGYNSETGTMTIEISIVSGTAPVAWIPCPIAADWILEGKPIARIEHLSSSADSTASTYFWDCTAGRFNWFYSFDETLHILEGSVALKDPAGALHRVVAGDTVFFPAGSQAEWTVERYIRKLAFCRTPLPGAVIHARNIVRRIKRLGRRGGDAPGMFPTG